MAEIMILVAKFGMAAIPHIFSEFGLFAVVIAFFAFMPIGHFTVGVLLVLIGALWPKFPDHDSKHQLNMGISGVKSEVNGTIRTAVLGVGALVILGSFYEITRVGL